MREAIGGTLLMQLVITFIFIYVAIFCIAINYSIAFKVKNQVINIIESYEGLTNEARDKIDTFLGEVQYYNGNSYLLNVSDVELDCTSVQKSIKICWSKQEGSINGYYYKVTSYASFSFPFIGTITNLPISGESRLVMYEGTRWEKVS